jgi:hypothetical protein
LKAVSKSSLASGRFGRMFRWLKGETYEKHDLNALALAMIQFEHATERNPQNQAHVPEGEPYAEGPDILMKLRVGEPVHEGAELLDTAFGVSEPDDENPAIPAGFTYFGQLVDHDLTFDPNSSLQKQNDPDALEDFRTPRMDLDSLYGRGPDDQPYLYEDQNGVRFLLGRRGGKPRPADLPRNGEQRALVGDPRNDENAIVSQLQVVLLNFHNRVIDKLMEVRPELPTHEQFAEAQRIVRWHYQYLVLNDYLKRIVGKATWQAVFLGNGTESHPKPRLQVFRPKTGEPYMPVEFSAAAFRFGHSMVRPSYALRADRADAGGSRKEPFTRDPRFHRVPIFSELRRGPASGPAANLQGFGELSDGFEIDWHLFFCRDELPTEEVTTDGETRIRVRADVRTQPGYRIDTKLVDPLASGNRPDGIPSLAYRNLVRGSTFELPSGQAVARALGVKPLTEHQLWDEKAERPHAFAYRAPLWFYILREAELTKKQGLESDGLGGHHLGEVGGRIVAEVLTGVALHDHTSYLYQDPTWTPLTEKERSGFDAGPDFKLDTVFDLIRWTTNGAMTFG